MKFHSHTSQFTLFLLSHSSQLTLATNKQQQQVGATVGQQQHTTLTESTSCCMDECSTSLRLDLLFPQSLMEPTKLSLKPAVAWPIDHRLICTKSSTIVPLELRLTAPSRSPPSSFLMKISGSVLKRNNYIEVIL